MSIRRFAFGAFLLLAPTLSHAQLRDYWSFNDQNLDPDFGDATLSTSATGVGFHTRTFDLTGTTVNAQPGEPAGHALTFIDGTTVFSQHRLTLSGLNFTGLSNVAVSYAVRSDGVFEIGETASISYRIGDGEWSAPAPLALPTSVWEVRGHSFGSTLDGATNVSIRIEHAAVFEVAEFLRFDNLTVTAVPEPAVAAALTAVGVAGVAIWRKRRGNAANRAA